jgi:Berberine and berberine like
LINSTQILIISCRIIISSNHSFSIHVAASLTLFGLDAYFKAYSFTLLFSSKKRKAFFYDMKALLKRSAEPTVHFIVEASWISHSPYLSGSGLSHTRRGNNNYIDETHQKLKDVNKEYNATLGDYKDIVISREWLLTDRTWSVPSYDLVWGAGHSYGGATIIVDKDHEEMTIEKSFERFKMHVQKDTGKCSDCVIVFHRIGEKLKNKVIGGDSQGLSDKKLYTESFNPFRQNGSLWVEMDCGHFFPQRDSWPACSQFVDDAQAALDHPIPLSSKSHYPNVPNLVTESWREQYYGAEGYRLLQEVKQIWDPSDVFHHAQSVSPSTHKSSLSLSDSDSIDELFPEQITSMKNTSHDANEKLRVTCSAMYDRAANADLRNLLDLTRPLKHLKQRLKSSQEAAEGQ